MEKKFTKFEQARMIGSRALQISMGAPFLIKISEEELEKIGYSPIEITILKIGDYLIVDPLPQEEKAFDARLTVAVSKDGQLCALQKGGKEPLTIENIDEMITLAKQKSIILRKKL